MPPKKANKGAFPKGHAGHGQRNAAVDAADEPDAGARANECPPVALAHGRPTRVHTHTHTHTHTDTGTRTHARTHSATHCKTHAHTNLRAHALTRANSNTQNATRSLACVRTHRHIPRDGTHVCRRAATAPPAARGTRRRAAATATVERGPRRRRGRDSEQEPRRLHAAQGVEYPPVLLGQAEMADGVDLRCPGL
jgi:hypothetical protein